MGIFQITLILATFLCSLVAGFLFAFAIVAMPGIRGLNDREFIRAFQVMDLVIQNNQPVFVLVWLGSVVALVTSTVLGIGQLDGAGLLLIILAALAYLIGVQSHIQTLMSPVVDSSKPNQSRGTCINASCSSQSFLSVINMFLTTS